MPVPTYTTDTIAKLLDLTPRRVQQLVDEGVFPRAKRGHYELVPVVRGYVRHLRERAAAHEMSGEYGAHRARLTKARAAIAEMELAQIAASLVPADEVEAAWEAVTAAMRSRLLTVASNVAPRLMTVKGVAEAQDVLRAEIHAALGDLASLPVEVDEVPQVRARTPALRG